ncbi:MAG: Gfo/Idh/MocA family oxidoreductase [Burkholderiaceae bacterium]
MTEPVYRIGIVGLGAAGQAFLPAIYKHAGFELAAICEPVLSIRERFTQSTGASGYASLAEMLDIATLDAVYIASPTPLHVQHVLQAVVAKKHVLIEKPMATSLLEAERMVNAAEDAGVNLVVGHSHSYDAPIQAMHKIIASDQLGRVRMVNTWCFTDWIYRPRRPDELDTSQGGGVTFRQGAHQFDILRLLCGGLAHSAKARSFDWDARRPAIGAHSVFLDFGQHGPAATAVYNGYGGLSSMDLCFDISEWGFHQPLGQRRWHTRTALPPSAQAELAAKQARATGAIPPSAPHQPFFGLTIAHCEGGDIRQTPQGLRIHTAQGVQNVPLPTDRSPRDLVLDEFYEACLGDAPTLHNGRWGLANLEVCEAAIASSASGREVLLRHQVPVMASEL